MMNRVLPPLWLLIGIVGLPQLSETVYTPALPDIAESLSVAESLVELTLTLFLAGFALGTLVWGRISDSTGRKPCLIAGMLVYIAGCAGCWASTTITALLISRFIQAFGCSTGSVLGQAMCRDVFHGKALGVAFSVIAGALAFSPAVGPIIGGVVVQFFGWPTIFIVLMLLGLLLIGISSIWLPETHHRDDRSAVYLGPLIRRLIRDRHVLGCGILVAAANGIQFSYYAEGSFYLISLLGLSPVVYGMSFIGIACATIAGSFLSKQLHRSYTSHDILGIGIWIIFGGAAVFAGAITLCTTIAVCQQLRIAITLASMMLIMVGIGTMIPNALSLALEEYGAAKGTAASFFGFFYYTLIAEATAGMSFLHNGTLYPMPLYFLLLSICMVFAKKLIRST